MRRLRPRRGPSLGRSGWRQPLRLALRSAEIIRSEGWRALYHKARLRLWLGFGPKGSYDAELTTQIQPLAFPSVRQPTVSIVIPMFNNAIYSYNCLKAILEHTGDIPYEVIVVDDASTDETQQVLSVIDNIQVLRNPENMGFLETCNRGAQEARGQYIVFLNNDTLVQKGWLAALLATAERDGAVGLVGAKLLFPNGRLQEAGSIIWRDGSAWHCGRHDDPRKPQYNYVREVDYCSGACLLVRRDLFQRAGGFDRRYVPAYYEDTDLAFTVRQLGYRVLYQPKAEVVHFEGVSHGTDAFSGIRRFQEINRRKFIAKWEQVLRQEHRPKGAEPFLARDRRRGQRALVVDHHVPTWDRDSGSLRMYHILRCLGDLGIVVSFIPDDMVARQPYTEELQQLGIEVLYGPVNVKRYLERVGPYLDFAVLSRPEVARAYVPLLRKLAPGALCLYDTVELHFLREERRSQLDGDDSARERAQAYRELELAMARACDATIVVSSAEQEILHSLDPGLTVHLIPNIHPLQGRGKPFHQRRDLLFIGNFFHHPNEDAAIFLVKEILPLIKEVLPEVRLYMVGSNPSRAITALASQDVVVTGWVQEVAPYFEGARVFVAPLRYGAGVKGKLGQSLSFGLPAVTTSVGAEGMDLLDGREVLIADSPQEFASKVIQLYRDEKLWETISMQGHACVEARWTPEAVKARIGEILLNSRGP